MATGVEALDWPAQSHALNPFKQLWDELGLRLRARPNHPTTLMLVAEWKQVPAAMFQHSGKPCQKSGGCYSSKGGDQLHINADF